MFKSTEEKHNWLIRVGFDFSNIPMTLCDCFRHRFITNFESTLVVLKFWQRKAFLSKMVGEFLGWIDLKQRLPILNRYDLSVSFVYAQQLQTSSCVGFFLISLCWIFEDIPCRKYSLMFVNYLRRRSHLCHIEYVWQVSTDINNKLFN
jgi:hypothetical protein